MSLRISPPQRPTGDTDAAVECEQAIDEAVRELTDRVIAAGWPAEAAFEAIKRITDRQAVAYKQDPDPADDPVKPRAPADFSLAPF